MTELTRLDFLSNYNNKMEIVYAMNDLMEAIPFDKLTIAEICSQAKISRATFYRYFDNKYSIAQWHCDCVYSKGLNQIGRTLSWYEGYYISEAEFAEMRDFYCRVGKTGNYNALDIYAVRARIESITETLTRFDHVTLTPKLIFQIQAVSNCEVVMMPKWHYGEINATLEELCTYMVSMVPHDLFALLDTPLNPKGAQRKPSDAPSPMGLC